MVTDAAGGMMPTWSGGDVEGDGATIHFTRTGHGDKPPLVLAHGFSDNGLCWSRTARALETDFDVVMIDSRNHGGSGTGPGDAAHLADDVLAVVSGLGLGPVSAMGHSIGARMVAEFAAINPGLVARLVLEDPPWRADQRPAAEASDRADQIRAYIGSLGKMSTAELLDLGRTQHSEWDEEEYPAWVDAKRQLRAEAADSLSLGDWAAVAARIDCPTLLVCGDPDRGAIVTPEIAAQVVAANSAVSTMLIDGAGHNIRREQFERFVEVVGEFLRDG